MHSRDIDQCHRQAPVEDRTAQAEMPDRPFETALQDGIGVRRKSGIGDAPIASDRKPSVNAKKMMVCFMVPIRPVSLCGASLQSGL